MMISRCCTALAALALTSVVVPLLDVHVVRGTPLAAQVPVRGDSAEVVRIVDAYHRALANGDSTTVSSLLAPDGVILESGTVETRTEYLSHHLAADIAFAQAVPRERGAIRVVVRGDVAWATSTSTTRGEYRGRAIDSLGAELMVLVRSEEGWRIPRSTGPRGVVECPRLLRLHINDISSPVWT